jgi:hypothetical protein
MTEGRNAVRVETRTAVRGLSLVDVIIAVQREEEEDAGRWTFERVFERACADVQLMFRSDQRVPGHLIIGLGDGPIVVTPYAWATNAERDALYDRLSRAYQGEAAFYVRAGESWSASGGGPRPGDTARHRIVRVAGQDRERKVLSRGWLLKHHPEPHLVEHDEVFRRRDILPELLFNRFRPDDSRPGASRMKRAVSRL